ncbi:Signal transduction histidine kinase [Cyclonatronum proteinivorum]|uniref:histidine kinase n=1 Tax=Cyclonatronum proteinivorum TaxID=1457365 RepID=A0A345ULE9_9BACT|nr:response regulator [Cyclonatronum proteinivorum]AXJ01301.1 Signal transduction histidine kinase [Cyclonatronum proteinivorum]
MVGIGYSVYNSPERSYFSEAINMAGSQRMRTMLIANYAQQLNAAYTVNERNAGFSVDAAEILTSELQVYRRFATALLQGDPELGVAPNHVPEIKAHLSRIEPDVAAYIRNAEQLLRTPEQTEYVLAIVHSAMQLKNEFDVVTGMYQAGNDKLIARQRLIDMLLITFALIITVIGLFLTRKIRRQEESLIIATEQADAASKAKSQFLANMSHEIRTPLNGVIGFTDLLKETELSDAQKQYVESANISGHILLGIINDILDFSKIEAGMMSLESNKTDIIELIENSVEIIRFAADKKRLEVLLNVGKNIPRYAWTDPVRLKQILANLLGNAVKFTEAGEIELHVSCTPLDDVQSRLRFEIRDTGIGISEENQKKLFRHFSQADISTTRKYGGSGLGLAISQMIAHKMGSSIHMQSEEGKGSVFSFEITTRTENGNQLSPDDISHIRHVLITDDNANNLTILENLLIRNGIQVTSCRSGAETLKELESGADHFDLLICDYHMPEMDGLETIRRIRTQLNLGPDTLPVILLHSSSDEIAIGKFSRQYQVYARMTKPLKATLLWNRFAELRAKGRDNGQLAPSETEHKSGQEKKGSDIAAKILIAEDNAMNMHMISALLKKNYPNATLIQAKNGEEAIAQNTRHQPDLILMDVQMPERDGISATRAIRIDEQESAAIRHVPIIALTAGALKEDQVNCLNAGMDDFLTKPIDPTRFSKTINRHLQPQPHEKPAQ